MSHVQIDIRAEVRARRLLTSLLILFALMLSIAQAIQRRILTEGFVPSAFAASAVPSLGAGLAETTNADFDRLTSTLRFATPSTIRRSIPARGGLLSGGLPSGLAGGDPTVAGLSPAGDINQPVAFAANDPVGTASPSSASGRGAGSGNPSSSNPLGSANPAALGGGGGAILPSAAIVPEPATWLMMVMGVFGLGVLLRRMSNRAVGSALV
jgi:hypothetical protein